MKYRTQSALETQRVAARLAKKTARQKPGRRALVVGLVGDLGSGKTTFVKGFARGLGIRRQIISPTFTVMRRYRIPHPRAVGRTKRSYYRLPITSYQHLIHVDCYRVHKPAELKIIKFESWLADPTAIVLIEWADLIDRKLLRRAKIVRFTHREEHVREVVA